MRRAYKLAACIAVLLTILGGVIAAIVLLAKPKPSPSGPGALTLEVASPYKRNNDLVFPVKFNQSAEGYNIWIGSNCVTPAGCVANSNMGFGTPVESAEPLQEFVWGNFFPVLPAEPGTYTWDITVSAAYTLIGKSAASQVVTFTYVVT